MADYYDPKPVKQGDGTPYEWLNCTCASAAMVLDRDTSGRYKTTGGRVRSLTGDRQAGTNLGQVDYALRLGWPPEDHMDPRYRIAFTDLMQEIDLGRGAILQGGYSVFRKYGLSGSPSFYGNHSVYVNEVHLVWSGSRLDLAKSKAWIYDPLWDGRRSYIPSMEFRWVSLKMLYEFAALLSVRPKVRLGYGLAYAGLTRRTKPTSTVVKPSAPSWNYGSNTMIVAGGLRLSSSHRMKLKAGQPLYIEPKTGAAVVTKMSKAADVHYFGNAAPGWRSVLVSTGNFPDKVMRPVLVYVPLTAGDIYAV